ncbi:hypothetical protein BDY19DRAFT_660534 [Irpex rosettiformis]|uniref:Uncharacterized protein n=1 Tax=Irpex rosettiformis TaxID=378272 RepID=A0ACB8TNB9_9APHY|nr:hypothetical protein BDY19DRAFT_660534 [Irpex rosettiformis]
MWSTIRTPSNLSPVNSHSVEAGHHSPHQLPPSSAAHREPSSSKAASLTASFRSVLHRLPTRAPSSNSLHSAYSAASAKKPAAPIKTPTAQNPDYQPFHPYAAMVAAPLPVVSSHDSTEDEDECPVCLEPLSFSFRLPGEKPHIVPECGHALHEVSSHYSPAYLAAFISLHGHYAIFLSRALDLALPPAPQTRTLARPSLVRSKYTLRASRFIASVASLFALDVFQFLPSPSFIARPIPSSQPIR